MSRRERREFTEDFKREAVRLTETSGRTIAQVAEDLGIGLSSLTRWKRQFRDAELLAGPHEGKDKELARLRKENELLRQERDPLKKPRPFSPRRQVDEVPACRCEQGRDVSGTDVCVTGCQREWFLRLEEPDSAPASTG